MTNSSTLKTFMGITETGPLIIKPLERTSVAIDVSTLISTVAGTFRFPRVTGDSQAAWTAEGAEITESETTADEVEVIPKKLAALSKISNELANDTSPEAQEIIGRSIARDIAKKLDLAFFGSASATTAVQPGGLEYLGSTVTAITQNPAFGTDPYSDAIAEADALGLEIGAFIVDPATAKTLAKLKIGTGSNVPLFGTGATNGISRNILGVPLRVSPAVLPNTAWGIPKESVYTVLRQDVSVVIDKSVYFSSDSIGIRSIIRVAWGFVQPEAMIRIRTAP